MKQKFHKEYSRDNSMILQEAWFKAISELKGISNVPNPYSPNNIFYIEKGLVEIWENYESVNYVKDCLLQKNIEDKDFLKDNISLHENNIDLIKPFWDKSILESKEELKEFVELAYEGISSFIIFYFTAMNEEIPTNFRKLAFEIREKDIFFTASHNVIKKTLTNLFPHTKSYETTVLTNEIKNPPSAKELKRRWETSVIIPEVSNENISLKEFANNHSEYEFVFNEIKNNSGIKGQTAQGGKTKGTVKIVCLRDEISKIKDGDIIVSPMTMPDYLPVMKKAAGFITDEGGITSHAAIVARELRKPCIIGTKIATKVLKDGDMVEVDANKGIVRIVGKQ